MARQLLGLGEAGAKRGPGTTAPVCEERPKRNGGFLIEVREPVEHLSESDARYLRELLETQIARVDARLHALTRR
jgi:hypothetical protein